MAYDSVSEGTLKCASATSVTLRMLYEGHLAIPSRYRLADWEKIRLSMLHRCQSVEGLRDRLKRRLSHPGAGTASATGA